MKVSFLVVTNRPQFYDWYLWNIDKQTYDGDAEIIVIDNSVGAGGGGTAHWSEGTEEHGWPLTVYYKDSGRSIGEYRQMALDYAEGDYITFVDDDDWHHPQRTEWLLDGIEDYEASLLLTEVRLVLKTMTMFPYREGIGYPYIPFMLVRRELAQSIPFPNKSRGEDTDWTDELIKKVGWEQIKRVSRHFPSMILIHGSNTYHSEDRFTLDLEMDGEPLPEKAPFGVEESEWIETLKRLSELRGDENG